MENIYELAITNNYPANKATEDYFAGLGAPPGTPYDKDLSIVAEQQIKEEFRQGYVTTFAPENVLAVYQKGCETLRYDFMISTAIIIGCVLPPELCGGKAMVPRVC